MHKNHLLNNKLSSYTALAIAMLAGQQVESQVVYTDVDPDVDVLEGDLYGFDLDNSGVDDFGLTNVLYSGIGAMNIINYMSDGVAGYIASVFGSTFPFASVHDAGEAIGPSLDWFSTTGNAPLLWGSFAVVGSFGQWNNISNKFVGLRMKMGADFHYGWARLDVSHTMITLKDYAFNETPNAAINTTVGIEDPNGNFFPTVYTFESGVHIELPQDVKSATVIIYDLSGREVYTTDIYGEGNIAMHDFASGMYAVKIQNGILFSTTMVSIK